MTTRIRIKQEFIGIETVSRLRLIGAMHAIPVDRSRTDLWQVTVPDLVCVFRKLNALYFCLALGIEQAQLNFGGMG